MDEPKLQNQPPARLEKVNQLLRPIKHGTAQLIAKLPDSDKPLYRRRWIWASLGVSGGIIAFGYATWSLDRSLPDTRELYTVVRQDTLTIKSADGSILQQQGPATREKLNLEQLPKPLIQAFIASEDRRFYNHNGIDYLGIGRAVFANLRSRDVVEGASTITQQLARILFLTQERSLLRKLKEVRLAQKIEEKLTKEQILERYLNLVYLGSGAYGVADAAWVYFSKSVDDLTLPEAATIAGLAPAPSLYSPAENPDAATQRRNLVLQRMEEEGFITAAQKQAAVNEPLTVKESLPKRLQVEAPYFTTYIQKELPKYVSPDLVEAGGLTVETTLNLTWQKAAEEAVKKTVEKNGRWQNFKQAALVAIDPRTGEIKAMVGGKDFDKSKFNRVTQAQRQPGSTFKGFVYAAAVATGINPTNGYLDAPLIIDGYEPKNYSETFRGWLNMRDALTASINVVAVKVLLDVGFEPTINLARSMGIKSELKPTYSLALGSSEVNLLELTSAYGSFATQGFHTETHGIRRVLNRRGDVLWSSDYKPKRVLDTSSAAIMTWMLQNVVQHGTGAAAQLDRPVAGKTGTSDESRDLWFIGFVPQVVTGVWLGNDDNKPTWGKSGTAAYTWHEFMEKAVEGMPKEEFPERPKLEGRVGSIKKQPIKPKRIINRPIPSQEPEQSSGSSNRQINQAGSDNSRSDRSTRRRRSSRRYYQQQQQETETPRRRYRRRSRVQETTRSQSSESSTPRRRRSRRRVQSDPQATSPQPRVRRRSAPATSAAPKKERSYWRERLKPKQSSSETATRS